MLTFGVSIVIFENDCIIWFKRDGENLEGRTNKKNTR